MTGTIGKDLTLQVRIKATDYERDDEGHVIEDEQGHGKATGRAWYLDQATWPPRHEFPTDWLLRAVSDGAARVSDTEVVLTFANATATYTIVTDEHHGEQIGDPDYISSSASIWGYLAEGEVQD